MYIRTFLVVLLGLCILVSCGGDQEQPKSDAAEGDTNVAAQEDVSESSEVKEASDEDSVFENKFFKAEIADGWTVFDDSRVKMMRIYPENDTSSSAPTIHLKFEGNGKWTGTPEKSINYMAEKYNGTSPEKVTIEGMEYYKTTYEYGGAPQTMLVAKKDGNKITLTLIGKGYDSNEELKEILNTIKIK